MKLRKVIGLQYLKDFSSLFFSNILQKIFGVIREPIIAYFFGSSLIFAHYLLLKTAADFFFAIYCRKRSKSKFITKIH